MDFLKKDGFLKKMHLIFATCMKVLCLQVCCVPRACLMSSEVRRQYRALGPGIIDCCEPQQGGAGNRT